MMVNHSAILSSVHEAMQNNPLFGDLLTAGDREFLMNRGMVRPATPGTILCHQNQRDNRVFIVINGTVEVSERVNGSTIPLGNLGTGELFGEISALFMIPRIATVTVTKPSVFLEIPGEALEELIQKVPVVRDAVLQRYRNRTLQTALSAVHGFGPLSKESLEELCDKASILTFRKDDLVIKEGEQGDALYIINYGVARVHINLAGKGINLALLRTGDYFGERSLLTGAPRAASISALTQMEVVRLGCEEFLEFIQKYPHVRDNFDLVAYERHEQTKVARTTPETRDDIQGILTEIQMILNTN